MGDVVFDEIVSAVEILAAEAMMLADFFFQEAEVLAEFVVETAEWMERVLFWVTALVAEF